MTEAGGAAPPVVAILGGGFTGAALAYHLARTLPREAARIVVIEPRETLGAGLAYSTGEPAHRINVPAARMSLESADPEQFARWLDASDALDGDPQALDARGVFPQRGVFGRYVAAMLAPRLADGAVLHRRARATRIDRRPDGSFVVALSDGTALDARILALATTHPLPAVPAPLAPLAASPAFVADPYRPNALHGIAPDARVLVVGNGLTAADVVATLDRRSHRGPIVALSRNGLRSRGHPALSSDPFGDFASTPARTALDLLRRVRRTLGEAASAGIGWHPVLDAVRIQGRDVWQALSPRERRRLVRHLRSFWDVHRFRIAPQVEAVLDRLAAEGRLHILAAALRSAQADGADWRVAYRRRGSRLIESRTFDAVVNTTGPNHRGVVAREPIDGLHAAGLVCPDAVGLGLATAEDGRALGLDGRPVAGLFIAGPLARGTFGELMGLPQVTLYAEFVAERIAEDLRWIADTRAGAFAAAAV